MPDRWQRSELAPSFIRKFMLQFYEQPEPKSPLSTPRLSHANTHTYTYIRMYIIISQRENLKAAHRVRLNNLFNVCCYAQQKAQQKQQLRFYCTHTHAQSHTRIYTRTQSVCLSQRQHEFKWPPQFMRSHRMTIKTQSQA